MLCGQRIRTASARDSVALLSASPRSIQTGAVQSKGVRCLVSMKESSGNATAG